MRSSYKSTLDNNAGETENIGEQAKMSSRITMKSKRIGIFIKKPFDDKISIV
jgi:hypothetical protein